MATTKGETVEEREEAVPELLLLEPEILAWLESTDRNVGNDSSPRRPRGARRRVRSVHTRVLKLKHGPTIHVRPLRNGDVDTVISMFNRLGEQARRKRFNGPKARLTEDELWQLATVDATHHALVAYVEGDRQPVAIARLVRDGDAAEIAFEVATDYRERGIGSALATTRLLSR